MRFDAIGRDIMALIAAWYEYSTVLYMDTDRLQRFRLVALRSSTGWHVTHAPPSTLFYSMTMSSFCSSVSVSGFALLCLALLCQAGCIIHRFEPCVSLVASLGFCSSVLVLQMQT